MMHNLIDQGCFTVIYVGNNCDVFDIHNTCPNERVSV
ncbi:MAG: hypothetical protein ACI884_001887 [Ulvibacter sp.]